MFNNKNKTTLESGQNVKNTTDNKYDTAEYLEYLRAYENATRSNIRKLPICQSPQEELIEEKDRLCDFAIFSDLFNGNKEKLGDDGLDEELQEFLKSPMSDEVKKIYYSELGKDECKKIDYVNKIKQNNNKCFMPKDAHIYIHENSELATQDPVIHSVIRTLHKFPWQDVADLPRERINIKTAESILSERICGEEKAKTRILEQIALMNRSQKATVKPLLFVGPPGTGKTEMGRIVAEILNRPAELISFPGIMDSWEVLGSGRGWRNADIGLITKAIIKHGELPVFILDEIDKTQQENAAHASPLKALITIFESDRSAFSDGFLEFPYSLKHAVFIMTANDLSQIPMTLRTRAEIVCFTGTKKQDDRRYILENHIFPALYENYLLSPEEFTPSKEIIDYIMMNSTDNTGGVRNMLKKAEVVFTHAIYMLEREELKQVNLTLADLGEGLKHDMMFQLTTNF